MDSKDLSGEMSWNEKTESPDNENATNLQEAEENTSVQVEKTDNVADDLNACQQKYDDLNDSYLRLMAEFDNYRKRTLKEKADLIKSGGEAVLTGLLPVIDDFERALQNIRSAENIQAVAEGIELIYSKFMSYLLQQGVKPIDSVNQPFDTEMFEAVAIIPAPEKDLRGKTLENIQTGYTLYDKVIRHAKVVVGE